MKIVFSFSIVNVLLAVLLYQFDIKFWIVVLYSVIFFYLLHLKILILTKIANKNDVEPTVTAFGLNIGLKFLFSLIFISTMYYTNAFVGKLPILIFMFYYFSYTFLMARYGVNKLI